MKKPTKAQREVLDAIVNGRALHSAHYPNRIHWFFGDGDFSNIHGNTGRSLCYRGFIVEKARTPRQPYWRRDYELTPAGREALK